MTNKTLKQQFMQYAYDSDMTLADRDVVLKVSDALAQTKKWLEQNRPKHRGVAVDRFIDELLADLDKS